MPKFQQPFTLAGYGMGDEPVEQPTVGTLTAGPADLTRGEQRRSSSEGRFVIGGFNIRDPETIDDPELRELAIRYRDAQAAGQDTSELRRAMAARVSDLLRQRASDAMWNPTDLALWSAGGAAAGYGISKATGWDTRKSSIGFGLLGFIARVFKGLPAYAGARLASAVIGGAATAQRTPEAQAADQTPEAVGYWR